MTVSLVTIPSHTRAAGAVISPLDSVNSNPNTRFTAMKSIKYILLAAGWAQLAGFGFAQELEPKLNDPYFEHFKPVQAPRSSGLMLKKGAKPKPSGIPDLA